MQDAGEDVVGRRVEHAETEEHVEEVRQRLYGRAAVKPHACVEEQAQRAEVEEHAHQGSPVRRQVDAAAMPFQRAA